MSCLLSEQHSYKSWNRGVSEKGSGTPNVKKYRILYRIWGAGRNMEVNNPHMEFEFYVPHIFIAFPVTDISTNNDVLEVQLSSGSNITVSKILFQGKCQYM